LILVADDEDDRDDQFAEFAGAARIVTRDEGLEPLLEEEPDWRDPSRQVV